MSRSEELRRLAAEACDVTVEAIGDDRPLSQYGLDSVRAIELIVAIEEKFDISISEEAARSIRTFADVVRLVDARLA
jgi:acyl carrier protein